MERPGDASPQDRLDIGRSAGLVSLATLISRILGLIREQVFAHCLGARAVADAFLVAFRLPNLLRDLFGEGILSAAFVPTFTDYIVNRSKRDAFELAALVINTIAVVVSTIVLVGILLAPHLVHWIAAGFSGSDMGGKVELTVTLTRIMFPFLLFVSLASIAMGILNAHRRFFLPALAPALFNLVSIAGGVVFYSLGYGPHKVAVGWALATLGGGFAQMAVQYPTAMRIGLRLRPALDLAFRSEGMRRILKLMAPMTIGMGALQINIFINTNIASRVSDGAVAWLSYAFRILLLPVGIFAVAISTVTITVLSHDAARKDLQGLVNHLARSLRLCIFLALPSTFLLLGLGEPLIRLLFEHGRFVAADTEMTAVALSCYAIGLLAYSAVKVTAPSFYVLDASRIPMAAAIAAVVCSVTISLTTYKIIGHRGIALATATGSIVNITVLLVMFVRRVGPLREYGLVSYLFKVMTASVSMGAVAYLFSDRLETLLPAQRTVSFLRLGQESGCLLASAGAGIVIFVAVTTALGVGEAREIGRFVGRQAEKIIGRAP